MAKYSMISDFCNPHPDPQIKLGHTTQNKQRK